MACGKLHLVLPTLPHTLNYNCESLQLCLVEGTLFVLYYQTIGIL